MHRIRASVVQAVNVFTSTPPEKTLPTLKEFGERQLRCTNKQLPDISDLSVPSIHQDSLDLEDGGQGVVPVRVFAVTAYVGSKIDTAHAAAQLPGQSLVTAITAPHPLMLTSLHNDH